MENLTNWCVYMHENRINGKKYIGITSQKPTKRWQNGKHYDGNAHFYAAICKYGWDGFRHDILYTELTQEEAERLEVELIKKYQTQDPAKGYNLADGGAARKGWHHTEEARKKMSLSRKGRSIPEETREKIREANKGHGVSAEARKKMSLSKLGKPGNKPNAETRKKMSLSRPQELPKAWKAVTQLSLDGTFIATYQSRKEAAAATNTRPNGISACCKGQRQTAGGFRWVYAEAVVGE